MPIDVRVPTDDDLDAILQRDEEAFGEISSAERREQLRGALQLDRFLIAVDGTDLVGLAGSHEKTLTMPGGREVPVGGTTWVSVAPTHRRRGLLRTLMQGVHDDIAERREIAAVLVASEGGIYERFGYGVATRWRVVEIDRRRTHIDPRFVPADPGVRLVDPADHVDRLVDLFERHHRGRVGEISRSRGWMERHLKLADAGLRCLLHADGFAYFRVTADWGEGEPNHELRVLDLVAVTPDAHVALWHTILSHDLVGPIRARTCVSIDDPLPYLLTDPRALKTVAYNDMLWVCPLDVGALLDARSYRVDDALVAEVVERDLESAEPGDRWLVTADGSERTDDEADLRVTRGALGALSLGGVSATELAAGHRARADVDVLRRADALFGWSPIAHCSTPF